MQLSRGSKGLFGILGGLLALVFGIALAAVTWVSRRRLAAAFGKDKNFATGLFLLGPVFMLMLGCSSAKYLGPDPAPIEETIPVKDTDEIIPVNDAVEAHPASNE